MPIEKLHKQRKYKNYAVLAALAIFMFFVFGLTIAKLSGSWINSIGPTPSCAAALS